MSDHNLRKSLIRLAHANPRIRPHVLPLLTKQAGGMSLNTTLDDLKNEAMNKWFDVVWSEIAHRLGWEVNGRGQNGGVLSDWDSDAWGGRLSLTYDFHRSALTLTRTGMGPKKIIGDAKIRDIDRISIKSLVDSATKLARRHVPGK